MRSSTDVLAAHCYSVAIWVQIEAYRGFSSPDRPSVNMFSQLARGNSTSFDVAEHLGRSQANAELMREIPGDGMWTFAELLQKLDHHQKISASWTSAIPYNEFTKPVLDVIDTLNMKIALAISKTTTLDSCSDNLGELGKNV